MWQCLRKRDAHLPHDLLQFGQTGSSINEAIAIRAECNQVANLVGIGPVLHHVGGGFLRASAPHAIDFTRLAGSLVSCPAGLKEGGKLAAKDQRRAFFIAEWQPLLYPCPNRVLVLVKQSGYFLHGVTAVDFDKAGVGAAGLPWLATFPHFGKSLTYRQPPKMLSVRLHSSRSCVGIVFAVLVCARLSRLATHWQANKHKGLQLRVAGHWRYRANDRSASALRGWCC